MRFNLLVWTDVLSHLFDLAFAFALALPIGWDREKESRSAGLRTFPLVAVASCGFVLMGNAVFGERSPDQSRLLQGLIAGIGFIGGGAILRDGRSVMGTATAASLWNTGVMGAAVGFALYDIGIVLGLLNLATLRLLAPFKREHAENPASKHADDSTS
jgi:putative Mg2+ transporter-C (MgtC) family protein